MKTAEVLKELEERLPEWYNIDQLMMLSLAGSRGYRLHTDDSDYDFFAVVMPPMSAIIGVEPWESYTYTGKSDIFDLKVYSPRKYMEMCMKGSIISLEPLFMPTVHCHQWMHPWVQQAEKFVTKSTISSILGYTTSMLRRFTDRDAALQGEKRRRLIDTYGYDCSAAAHCLRWLWMGWELLFTDSRKLDPTMGNSPMRDVVMRIKRGEMSVEDVTTLIEDYFHPLEESGDELRARLGHLDVRSANQILTTIHLNGLGI